MSTTTPTSDLSSFLGSDPGLNRLYDNVQVQVPGVGLSAVKMAAWNAIEEFYLRSTVRREPVNWQMAIGVSEIDFNPFDETWLVAWVLNVTGLHRPQIVMPGIVRDTQQPTAVRTGTALLALKPVNFNVVFPPELFSHWFETILAGTLFKLFSQPAKPYSSPQIAVTYARAFNAGIAKARGIADKQYTDGGGRWRYPLFAMGRRKN